MASVLVVDDDGAVWHMIVLLLRSHGYETETASDGAQALAQMRQRRPCLVVLDIRMPIMDGWQFRKHQLDDPTVADVPVICMTGVVHPEDVEHTLGVPCLGKPVDFSALIRAVEKCCRPPAS
jgi:CheY-like chemotaxis protein